MTLSTHNHSRQIRTSYSKNMPGSFGFKKWDDVEAQGLPGVEDLSPEILNLNALYLRAISDLLVEFMNSSLQKNIEVEFDVLDTLISASTPKIRTDDLRGGINTVAVRMNSAIVKDSDGEVMRVNPTMVREIRRNMRRMFELILVRFQDEGMLTFKRGDMRKAMGRFSSA